MTPLETDLLIVGAGIAGVTIAERVTREAHRRGGSIRVAVVDRNPSVGTGSSRNLQGWFHSGALYATLADPASRRCLERSAQCLSAEYGPESDFTGAGPDAWLGDPITFLLDPPDAIADSERARRIEAFAAGAPERDRSNALWRGRFRPVATPDRALDARLALHDLAAAAASRGTRFVLGRQVFGPDLPWKEPTPGIEPIEIRARHTVLTCGAALAPLIRDNEDALSVRSGIIVSATPSLCEESVVRLAADEDQNISHIAHTLNGVPYSAMGDSTSLAPDAHESACESVARHILDRARDLFGAEALTGRRVTWHRCAKLERCQPDGAEPIFGPAIFDTTGDGRILAVFPTKFSLFPSTATLVNDRLERVRLFDRLRPDVVAPAPPPPVACMLSTQLLGLAPQSESATVEFPHGTMRHHHDDVVSRGRQATGPHRVEFSRADWRPPSLSVKVRGTDGADQQRA